MHMNRYIYHPHSHKSNNFCNQARYCGNPPSYPDSHKGHNLYNSDPTPFSWMPYYVEPGRVIGDPEFLDPAAGDFRLTVFSDNAIVKGFKLAAPVDHDLGENLRYTDAPDIGAFELEKKIVWEGDSDEDWHNASNWSLSGVPGDADNVVIRLATRQPSVFSGIATVRGLILCPGSLLTVESPGRLNILGGE